MQNLLLEARTMPDAALTFARGVSEVHTPNHLIPLREQTRNKHRREMDALFAAINDRFNANEPVIGVFYAAGEMAVMAHVGGSAVTPQDRARLRQLWEALRNAQ